MNNLEWDRDIHQPFPMGSPPMMTPERIDQLAAMHKVDYRAELMLIAIDDAKPLPAGKPTEGVAE